MAFDFLDMFPDTQAGVAASQGALDIINNQYKGAMGFMEMENALMRTVAARRQLEEARRLDPLQKTVDAVKLLQGLNIENSGEMFQNVNPSDPQSINDALLQALPNMKTNFEADLAKTRASAQEQAARAQLLESGRNARDAADRAAESEKQMRKEANEHLEMLNKRYPKTPTSERKARELVTDYQALMARGSPEVARVFYNKHSALLAAAGFQAPGAKGKAPAQAAKPAEAKPKTYTSKAGKNYLIYPDGRIVAQ